MDIKTVYLKNEKTTIEFIALMICDFLHDMNMLTFYRAKRRRKHALIFLDKLIYTVFKSISNINNIEFNLFEDMQAECRKLILITPTSPEMEPYIKNSHHKYILDLCSIPIACAKLIKSIHVIVKDEILFDQGASGSANCKIIYGREIDRDNNNTTILPLNIYNKYVKPIRNNMVEYSVCKRSLNKMIHNRSTKYSIEGHTSFTPNLKIINFTYLNELINDDPGFQHFLKTTVYSSPNIYKEYRSKSNSVNTIRAIKSIVHEASIYDFDDAYIESIYMELILKFMGDFGQILYNKFQYNNDIYNITDDKIYGRIAQFMGINVIMPVKDTLSQMQEKNSNVIISVKDTLSQMHEKILT